MISLSIGSTEEVKRTTISWQKLNSFSGSDILSEMDDYTCKFMFFGWKMTANRKSVPTWDRPKKGKEEYDFNRTHEYKLIKHFYCLPQNESSWIDINRARPGFLALKLRFHCNPTIDRWSSLSSFWGRKEITSFFRRRFVFICTRRVCVCECVSKRQPEFQQSRICCVRATKISVLGIETHEIRLCRLTINKVVML